MLAPPSRHVWEGRRSRQSGERPRQSGRRARQQPCGASPSDRMLLVCDNASVHTAPELQHKLDEHGIFLRFLPPNMTQWLQPLDLVVCGLISAYLFKCGLDDQDPRDWDDVDTMLTEGLGILDVEDEVEEEEEEAVVVEAEEEEEEAAAAMKIPSPIPPCSSEEVTQSDERASKRRCH